MAGLKSVWGIDVGRSALKAIRLRIGAEGEVEMVGHDYVEHPKILSQPDADKEELIANALEKFLSRNDISNDKVAISVPGQHTLARFTKLPPVDDKRIPDIVKYEADQQIPFDMDEVIWDYQTFKDEDLPDVEVGIFAMKREQIRAHMLPFEQLGIEPILVQSGPLAVYNAVHFEDLLKAGETTIILDIGSETTDLIISTPQSLWTRTIPIGGNRFTEALVKAFKLSFSKAEKLKREAAKSRYARQIFQAMRPVFNDLVQELQRSIGFYSSTHRGARIERIITLGNACKLPGLVKYLQQNLGYDVEEPSAFKKLSGSEAAKAPQFTSEILSFAVPYGLALQALDQAKITSSLLPMEIAKQVVWQKKRPFIAAAAACLVLAGGTVWMRYLMDNNALAAGRSDRAITQVSDAEARTIVESGPPVTYTKRQRAQAILAAGNAFKRKYNELKSQGETERAQSELLVALQKDRAFVPAILNAIHSALPQNLEPYGTAETVEQYLAAVKGGAVVPRPQRKEVHISSFDFELVIGLSGVELPPCKLNLAPNFALGESDTYDGFWVRMVCTTANQAGDKFIEKEFLERLLDNGAKPKQGFFINRVHLTDWHELDPAKTRSESAAPEMTRGGAAAAGAGAPRPGAGRGGERPEDAGLDDERINNELAQLFGNKGGMPSGGRRPTRSQPAQLTAQATPGQEKNLDYVTEEELKGGLEFTVVLEVLIGDAPVSEEDAADTSDENAGGADEGDGG